MQLFSMISKKIKTFALVFAATSLSMTALQGQGLKNYSDSLSYGLGSSLQFGLKQQGIDSVKINFMSEAINSLLQGKPTYLGAEKAMGTVNTCMTEKMQQKPVTVNVDTFSYALGILVAQNLKQQGLAGEDFVMSQFTNGFSDAVEGKPAMSPEAANALIEAHLKAASGKRFAGVKERGEKFLAENGKKAGITTTASGLQYEVLRPGTGTMPKATDTVTTHYHGTLISGEVFDSSVERGKPIDFPVNRVIPGWTEALQLMKTGAKYRLYIPYNLAYGEQGAGGSIGPYEALIFDVELIKVNGKD
jgi:FKBP-type peptidyl-prolyl cis-trans isomerase FklB